MAHRPRKGAQHHHHQGNAHGDEEEVSPPAVSTAPWPLREKREPEKELTCWEGSPRAPEAPNSRNRETPAAPPPGRPGTPGASGRNSRLHVPAGPAFPVPLSTNRLRPAPSNQNCSLTTSQEVVVPTNQSCATQTNQNRGNWGTLFT